MRYQRKTLLVMAGGTGGHIMPGLAVAEYLHGQGWQVVWMGNPDGMEARLVPQRGFDMAWVKFSALRGKGLLRKLMLPLNLLRGCAQAWREIRRVRPDVVIGFGGYVTFPGGMMAALRGIPVVLHEQNSVAGLTNKVLAKIARVVLTGFPNVFANARWVGNPVRAEIAAIADPEQRYNDRTGPLRLLVVGGSLGAQALNTALPQALALIPEEQRPLVRHQSGEKHLVDLQAAYAEAGVEAELLPFIADMASAYNWADLVICRAGALTVAELAAAGLPSILVPFPHAVDDHQTENARFLANAGAAILLPQADLTPERLALLRGMERPQLLEMAKRAREMAKINATADVAGVCAALCTDKNNTHTRGATRAQ